MAKVRGGALGDDDGPVAGPLIGVTNANYYGPDSNPESGLAYQFAKTRRSAFIIHRPPSNTEEQWNAWLAYWRRKNIKHKAAKLAGTATVPAEWPWLFDAEWKDGSNAAPKQFAKPWPGSNEITLALSQKLKAAGGQVRVYNPSLSVIEGPSNCAEVRKRFDERGCKHYLVNGVDFDVFEEAMDYAVAVALTDKAKPTLPGATERERVIAGYAQLRREVDAAMRHMDVTSICDGFGRPRAAADHLAKGMTPAERLEALRASYAAQPATLSEELAGLGRREHGE